MKNPFSIYDFLGYLFPGVIFVLMIIDVFYGKNIFSINSLIGTEKGVALSLEVYFLFVIISYVMGHVVAYVSSLLVEGFANRVFGYPSRYLLEKEDLSFKGMWKKYFDTSVTTTGNKKKKKLIFWAKKILKGIVFIIMLPITFSVFTIGFLFEINTFITRQLDDYLIKAIIKKTNGLAKELKISDGDLPKNADTHRFVMHYAYINVKECQPKVNNYIALYGFLRCMSLLSCLIFDFLVIKGVTTINIHADVDCHLIIKIVSSFIVSYILFLGFVKFYRRNTLEDYMSVVVEKINKNGTD